MKKNNTKHKRYLKEDVDPSKIIDAIKKRYEIEINYASDDPNARGRRIVQPVAYGLSKANNPVLRAFQPFGDTKTKVPHWKLFRLDKITGWKAYRNKKFDTPPGQYTAEGEYNANGDGSMSEVFIQADFTGSKERYEKGGLKKYNDAVLAKKMEEDPLYKLKRNMKKASYMATNDVMKRVNQTPKKFQTTTDKSVQNAKEMAQVNNFGDDTNTSTVGPVTKINNNSETQQQTSHDMDYTNVVNNGPVLKTPIAKQETPEVNTDTTDNTETEVNNEINNKEEENNK